MIDINLLRLMKVRSDYNKIIGSANLDAYEDKTRKITKAIGQYYDKHQSHGKIDFTVFIPFFERNVYPKMKADDKAVYRGIIKNMSKNYPGAKTRTAILESIHEANLAYEAYKSIDDYNKGEDVDIVEELKQALDVYTKGVGVVSMPEVDENIDDMLDSIGNEEGIKFRLGCLRASIKPLQGGESIIVAARPDQGKTSFLSSETTYMAPQMKEGECILWLNNEGYGGAIRPRVMQAALNCTVADLIDKKDRGVLYDEYYEAMGGKNRLRIMDIHGYNTYKVESLIESVRPKIIIYDMVDNVQGFGSEARTDLALEKMYQWAREKAVKYEATAIMTSQISAEGADMQYPPMSALKDSKTGKQGACDTIIMLGSLESKPEFASMRWVSTPKNKLRMLKSAQVLDQVTFDREKARYRDIPREDQHNGEEDYE